VTSDQIDLLGRWFKKPVFILRRAARPSSVRNTTYSSNPVGGSGSFSFTSVNRFLGPSMFDYPSSDFPPASPWDSIPPPLAKKRALPCRGVARRGLLALIGESRYRRIPLSKWWLRSAMRMPSCSVITSLQQLPPGTACREFSLRVPNTPLPVEHFMASRLQEFVRTGDEAAPLCEYDPSSRPIPGYPPAVIPGRLAAAHANHSPL